MTNLTAIKPVAFDLPTVAFFGRTLSEYEKFFDLRVDALKGCKVLDVAAGPSSFTAEATQRGVHATAVDPLYNRSPYSLAFLVDEDYVRTFNEIRRKPELIRLQKTFDTIEEAEVSRTTAARRFLADFAGNGVASGRYVAARLPTLPFKDNSFDLVLCAHLLFVYSKFYDYDFHLAACKELLRVSKHEVKLHPIVEPTGEAYHNLRMLIADLATEGHDAEVHTVDHEFFAGSNQTLSIRKNRG
ncbi:MAG: class I SAM-dependent methyltransferase [Verrucomicrobiota bacterium]|nr:class I SAM-dependent methyltransferase [Verrucomicrobiota bacterium]